MPVSRFGTQRSFAPPQASGHGTGDKTLSSPSAKPEEPKPGAPGRGEMEGLNPPRRCKEDRIALMHQDPLTLYCRREVAPALLLGRGTDRDSESLRFHVAGGNWFDARPEGQAGSIYTGLPAGGGRCFAELCYPGDGGCLVRLPLSDTMVLPPVGVSDIEYAGQRGVERPDERPASEPAPPPNWAVRNRSAAALSSFCLSSASLGPDGAGS